MAKKIFYEAEAREKVLSGAKQLYDAVKVTFGPKGQNVIIEKEYGAPVITHDGVTVAEAVELPDHPFFIGTQAHPEFKSRPNRPHPLFAGLVKAALEYRSTVQ